MPTYDSWPLQTFLDAFNLHFGRTHTVKLDAFQRLEQLLNAEHRSVSRQDGALCVGGHTIYCEPDPGRRPYLIMPEHRKD